MLKTRDAISVTDNNHQGLHLLIAGNDPLVIEHLKTVCNSVSGLRVTTAQSIPHEDLLVAQDSQPDILLLKASSHWREELSSILRRPVAERPLLLVCGLNEPEGLRMAMQAGARDCLPDPVSSEELKAALQRIVQEKHVTGHAQGRLLAVMNAKGGSGATLVACNLAQQLSQNCSVLLIDLDLQFGSVAHYLDLMPAHSHVDVLGQIGELDSVALRGFCTHFTPNMHVLGGRQGDTLSLPQDVRLDQLEQLLQLARSSYDWVIVDLPRCIDHLTGTTLDHADQILIILQQSLSHLKDATRLIQILRDELGVPASHMQVVINRYSKNAPVTLADIIDALHVPDPVMLPNDFAVVSESQNAGVPLAIHAPRAAITQGIQRLASSLPGQQVVHQGGLFRKAFTKLMGGDSNVR